ncbi:MAG: secretin N-terminal domain-containing protein, partial [bacterium]
MKNMRNYLFSLGASAVLTLSVALAQNQAPQIPPPAPAVATSRPIASVPPVTAVPRSTAPVKATPAPTAAATPPPSATTVRRTVTPAPVKSGSMVPPLAGAASSAAVLSADPLASGESKAKTTTPALKFDNAPADIILQAYAQETGKTLLVAPDAPKANITLKSQPEVQLTKEEYIEAIEVVLSMYGIVLEPFGEKFIKVFARKTVRTEGIKILMDSPDGGHPEKSKVVSQMIQLKSITIAEVQKALEGFKKPDGLIQTFERTNSLLVTDTQENVNRMMEIVKFIDQPLVATEEVNVRTVRFAKADDIKKRLEELVAESQKQTQAKEEIKANVAGSPGMTRSFTSSSSRPTLPGLSRVGTPSTAVTPNEILETLVNDADRGMIRGKVQIISDERSNQLIIITRTENMAFFDRIITVLDIETAPDVKVEVQRLEFADAEEVSTMLNDLIGNATVKKDEKVPANATKGTATPGTPEYPAKSATLAETLAARATRSAEAAVGEQGKSKLGQLSKDNIKILADKRTNALVMMGSVSDLAAIREIIKGMDIQLAQVLIETVALEVTLNKSTETGIDWVKRVDFNNENYRYKLSGGAGKKVPTDLSNPLLSLATNASAQAAAGLQYFATLKNLRLDAVIYASKTDDGAKVISSP